jgi:hypothetical protein
MNKLITNLLVFFVPWGVVNFSLFGFGTTRRLALAIISFGAFISLFNFFRFTLRFNLILVLQAFLLFFTVYPLFVTSEMSLYLPMILGGFIFNLLLVMQYRYFDFRHVNISYFAVSLFILVSIGFIPILLMVYNYGFGDMRNELKNIFSLNSFGNYNFALIFTSYFLLRSRFLNKFQRLLLYYVLIISTISIAVTLSRQNASLVILLLLVSSMFDSFFSLLKKITLSTVSIAMLLYLDWIPNFILQLLNRFTRIIDGGDSSQNQRFEQISKVLEVVSDHPAGIGVGYFYTYVNDRSLKVTESSYLDFMVGMGLYVVLYFSFFVYVLLRLYASSGNKVVVFSFIACFLFAALFNEVLHEPMFWIMLLVMSKLTSKYSCERFRSLFY